MSTRVQFKLAFNWLSKCNNNKNNNNNNNNNNDKNVDMNCFQIVIARRFLVRWVLYFPTSYNYAIRFIKAWKYTNENNSDFYNNNNNNKKTTFFLFVLLLYFSTTTTTKSMTAKTNATTTTTIQKTKKIQSVCVCFVFCFLSISCT